MNLNPRSIYNKLDEFVTFVEEEDIDLVFMSESHERAYPTKMGESQTLKEIINIEDFVVINNPSQRDGKCGRPALIINSKKFKVKDLTNTQIEIPKGVEIVWASITPKFATRMSKIQEIIVAAVYSKPNSHFKTKLLDHISDVFNVMSSKKDHRVHFILAGDTNELKLEPIVSLSHLMKQIVKKPTRQNPPRILDPVLTTLSNFYKSPDILPPLDNDPDKNGKPSDHCIIVVEPISDLKNNCARQMRKIIVRPTPEEKLKILKSHFKCEKWHKIKESNNAHEQAHYFHTELLNTCNQIIPEKTRKVSSDDQPWFTERLQRLNKKKKIEYHKNRRSEKWMKLNNKYKKCVLKTKQNFYDKNIKKLRQVKPHQWYSTLKYLSNFDQLKTEDPIVEDIKHISDPDQAALIVEKFAKVGNLFDALKSGDIITQEFDEKDIPQVSQLKVRSALRRLKTNKSTVKDDIPAKVTKYLADELTEPLTVIINTAIKNGQWPDIWKTAIITPVPKEYPTPNIDKLRGISGLFRESKIAEQIIAEYILHDMKA